ncbi:carbohydrate porin [Bradyrhizobium rifense]|nr:carbohydrate porin [Bradyrhizobium rifense]
MMKTGLVALGICCFLALGRTASADAGLGNLGHLAAEPRATEVKRAVAPRKRKTVPATMQRRDRSIDPGQPVPTKYVSLADVAPGLLPYFNNGPVFGIPGTVTGDIWHRTQLTGDWGGVRTDWARHGVFIDVYSTSYYQNVTSGGLQTGGAFVQNTQASINIDTGRAGLWSGGLLHLTLHSRFGDTPANTFTAGAAVPQYTGLAFPDPLRANDVLPAQFFLTQSLTKEVSVLLGKIAVVYLPDQTLFGDSYKYYFANFNFNKSPVALNFYNAVSWAALGAWSPSPQLTVFGGVLDPNSKADNFADHAFDTVNLYISSILSYTVGGLPGQFSPAFNWSNKPKLNLESPFGPLTTLAATSQAVGALIGGSPTDGLPANFKDNSWAAIANVSQYLYVMDDATTVAEKLRSGQPLRGIGIFGRVGYAPPATNSVTSYASVALVAHGLFNGREYDSFGAGFYYNWISNNLKRDIAQLTLENASASDESGIEVFYNFAVTPAVRLIPSYQHIWHPLAAQIAKSQDRTDLFLTRLTVAW